MVLFFFCNADTVYSSFILVKRFDIHTVIIKDAMFGTPGVPIKLNIDVMSFLHK